MGLSLFGQIAADQYDILYGDKDYDAECDLIGQIFQLDAANPVKSILDLGCGTGNHAIPLAQRGYQVIGVDRSSEMLGHAKRKSAAMNLSLDFLLGDIRSIDIGRQFDAVLMMFAVLGYQLTNEDVLAALHTVRHHLKPGGLFICDVWYGPAVLAIRPSDRVKVIPTVDGKFIRAASGYLDTYHHLVTIHYDIWRLNGKKLVSESEENHLMRYFFPQELALFLSSSGLVLQKITAFPSLDRPADETIWNILVIGMAEQ